MADTYVANHASVQNPKFVGAANISVSPRSPGKNRKPIFGCLFDAVVCCMHRKVNSENGRVQVPIRTVVKVVRRGQTSVNALSAIKVGILHVTV